MPENDRAGKQQGAPGGFPAVSPELPYINFFFMKQPCGKSFINQTSIIENAIIK